MMPIVRNTAIGSLVPDSNSKSGWILPFKEIPCERRTENTAAASVDETIDPSKKPSIQEIPNTYLANQPTSTAVVKTPSDARLTPRHNTLETIRQSVSSPPAKRMKESATTPTDWASHALSNGIRPGPSDPASIPISRNNSSAGIPSLLEVLLATTPSKRRVATTIRISSNAVMPRVEIPT